LLYFNNNGFIHFVRSNYLQKLFCFFSFHFIETPFIIFYPELTDFERITVKILHLSTQFLLRIVFNLR
jgi:hypothetical protein